MTDYYGNRLAEEWRPVTRRYPGKAYSLHWVLVALENGEVSTALMPEKEWWTGIWTSANFQMITYWMPYPVHPDDEK